MYVHCVLLKYKSLCNIQKRLSNNKTLVSKELFKQSIKRVKVTIYALKN